MIIGRLSGRRLLAASILASLLAAAPGHSQDAPPTPPTTPEPSPQSAMFHWGPFEVTPRFRIYSLGVDTNVFYTAFDRRTDFIAHGGPGLEVVIPLHGALKLRADGSIGYLYFARTESQRRLTGGGLGRLAYEGVRLNTGAQYSYTRTYGRLGFEVDRRVAQTLEEARADLRYGIGARFALGFRASATRTDVDEDQEFYGADLPTNLNRDTYLGETELSYALTPKTSFIVEADYQTDRFLLADQRDTESNRLGGGFTLDSRTFFSGRVIGGARSIRVKSLPAADRIVPYADVDLSYHFGPRTRLNALYVRNVGFSAFAVAEGDLPTLLTESYTLRLEKGLWRRLDLRLHAAFTQLSSDAAVLIVTPTGGPQRIRRNDRAREAGADLGYAFWTRLRIGLSAVYSDRQSQIADLGIEGLILGGTVTFIPD